jgi:hypothetical protein
MENRQTGLRGNYHPHVVIEVDPNADKLLFIQKQRTQLAQMRFFYRAQSMQDFQSIGRSKPSSVLNGVSM